MGRTTELDARTKGGRLPADGHSRRAGDPTRIVWGFTAYKNFFQPTMKLVEKVRVEGKIHRKYDQPKTPYQRLIESGQISAMAREVLMTQYESLNVAALRRRVEELRNRLFDHLSAKSCVESSARKRHGPGIRVGGVAHAIWMRKMTKGEKQ